MGDHMRPIPIWTTNPINEISFFLDEGYLSAPTTPTSHEEERSRRRQSRYNRSSALFNFTRPQSIRLSPAFATVRNSLGRGTVRPSASRELLVGNARDDASLRVEEFLTRPRPLAHRVSDSALSDISAFSDSKNGKAGPQSAPLETPAAQPAKADGDGPPKDLRFWTLMSALASTAILAALEGTIVSTALPTISSELHGGSSFLWTVNAYFLTSMAIQPLNGQLADIFGRKIPIMAAVCLFLVGTALCGAAQDINWLIAARAVQGLGGGGLQMLVSLIISDLVPIRERPGYLSMIFGTTSVANGLGPLFSGLIVSHTTWRWVFFMSIPLAIIVLVLLGLFMQTKSGNTPLLEGLKKIDYGGQVIFIGAIVALLISLTYAGTVYPWASWQTLVPLILGILGLIGFFVWEGSGIPRKPNMPLRIFNNRTSIVALLLALFHSVVTIWVIYFMPVYFQAVLLSDPQTSGIQLLPTILVILPFAMLGGKLLQRVGRYRRIHFFSFALIIISFGLYTRLGPNTSTAYWVLSQVLGAVGAGLVVGTLLPAAQSPLRQEDVAAVTVAFSFAKNFGASLSVTIPTSLFNNKFESLSGRISDPEVRKQLSGGSAYEHATADFVGSFSNPLRQEIIDVYSDSLQFIWVVGTIVAGVAFLLIFLEKHYELRRTVKSAYGMKEPPKKKEAGQQA